MKIVVSLLAGVLLAGCASHVRPAASGAGQHLTAGPSQPAVTSVSPQASTPATSPLTATAATATTPAERPVAVLGASWNRSQQGFGTARPKNVFNGGDPTGALDEITWNSWGTATATGSGTGNYEPPNQPVANSRPERALVEAFDLGQCKGKPAYLRLVWWFPSQGQVFDPSPYADSESSYDICTGGQSSGTGGLASPSEDRTIAGCPTPGSLQSALFGSKVYEATNVREIRCEGVWAAAVYDNGGNEYPGTFRKVDGVWSYFSRAQTCRRSDFPKKLSYICQGG